MAPWSLRVDARPLIPNLLLHIGYHKTATTWMQRKFFVPMHGFRQLAGHQEIFDHVVRPRGFDFNPDEMRDLLERAAVALLPSEVPVLSSEILSGHPFQGGRESDAFAARLHRIAPEAKILVSIRSQRQILPSVYMQYVLRGGTMPPERFFAGEDEIGYFGFVPEHFRYDQLVSHYQGLFGADRVHVLTQESLKADMDRALAALAAFAGATLYESLGPEARKPDGVSFPEQAAGALRRVNHLRRTVLNPWPMLPLGRLPDIAFKGTGWLFNQRPIATLLRDKRHVSAIAATKFAGFYSDSNARLRTIVTHPLDLSNYP